MSTASTEEPATSTTINTSADQKMEDAVEAGVAAAEGPCGEEVSESRKEEWKKRYREHAVMQEEQPTQRLKTVHEEGGYVTDASLKSSSTYVTDNKRHGHAAGSHEAGQAASGHEAGQAASGHAAAPSSDGKGPDQQQLDYRDSVEDQSVASVGDDQSVSSRNTWKSKASIMSHQKQLADRRKKDKDKYAAMTREERKMYNAKRRDKYHRQSQESRQKHRERERNRYHHSQKGSAGMSQSESQGRQARRSKLAQERLRAKSEASVASKMETSVAASTKMD